MKRLERSDAFDLRRFVGTAAMIAAAAELGIFPPLRPVPVKAIAKAAKVARHGEHR
jgi:hypothetical protein